jgi:hypothetical protein
VDPILGLEIVSRLPIKLNSERPLVGRKLYRFEGKEPPIPHLMCMRREANEVKASLDTHVRSLLIPKNGFSPPFDSVFGPE